VYTAKLVEEGGEGAFVATVRLADAFGGGGGDTAASYYIGEVKSDSGRNTNLFRLAVLYFYTPGQVVPTADAYNQRHW